MQRAPIGLTLAVAVSIAFLAALSGTAGAAVPRLIVAEEFGATW